MSEWAPPPTRITLRDGEVHVWRIGLEVTSPDAPRKRARQAIEPATLASIFRRYVALGSEPRIVHDSTGKPRIADSELDLRVSISHSGELALLGLSIGREIGVDVEEIRTEVRASRLAERLFAPAEGRALRELSGQALLNAFFCAWTRKEAYAKALGTGLGIGSSSGALGLDVLSDLPRPAVSPCALPRAGTAPGGREWGFADLDVGPGYAAALVTEGEDWRVSGWRKSPEAGPEAKAEVEVEV